MVVGYGPSEEVGDERNIFWKDNDRILDRARNECRLCIRGDLNGGIGERTRISTTGTFGVPGENDNGKRVVEFCAETGMCVSNSYLKHRSLHKYTRVAKGQDGVEVKSMKDLVLVNEDMLRYVQDVKEVRGMGRGLSDHHVVQCRVDSEERGGGWGLEN